MRYKLILSYDGVGYNGWQVQNNKTTIQGEVNRVLSQVLKCDIFVTASGRTDTDVSAIAQVAHFEYEGNLPKNIVGHCNNLLPESIRITQIVECADFHARFDAKRKTYMYKFYVSKTPNAYYDKFAYHVKYDCDFDLMQSSVKYLLGTHDFSSFCASNTQVVDKVRTIYDANLTCEGDLITFTITGNGFLYNMVRIIVGTLIQIGTKKLPADTMAKIIGFKDRKMAGPTVPARALTLVSVNYES